MPTVSVIIPTHNRPDLIIRAAESVLRQTYTDLELIVVDDGLVNRAQEHIASLHDARVRYIAHEKEQGGSAARNTGIRAAQGGYIAFLDDDDEWLPNKLELQMNAFLNAPSDAGFCFTAVTNCFQHEERATTVPDGIADYHELALGYPKGFLTVTLVVKQHVFRDVGMFDESLPSHQDPDLIIRISKKYKGLGINQPLVRVTMTARESIGSNAHRRIAGREMLLKKYWDEYSVRPRLLARNYFWLGLQYRSVKDYKKAGSLFSRALRLHLYWRYALHGVMMLGGGFLYRIIHR